MTHSPLTRRLFVLLALPLLAGLGRSTSAADKPNILYLTVDDMSCDSIGVFGCKLKGTSPNVDKLASEGRKFDYAHVVVGNCMPSRNVMYSGLYPHNNGVEGFRQVKNPSWPHLIQLLKPAGYFTAIRHKVSHSSPYSPFEWDLVLDQQVQASVKNVPSYYDAAKIALDAAKEAGKPFCLIMNVADPHKPFYTEGKGKQIVADPNQPSEVFTADEVPVPGFLPDSKVVREEMARYYSSVRRADDCVGMVLKALDESGQANNTLVVFLSDHGMPLPFSKTQVYHHSTHTPLIVRWPRVTKAGSVDGDHMVSAVDMLPTLLDVAGVAHPPKLDGRSFLPLIKGERQDGRDMVFKEYQENSGGVRQPMRSVETKQFGYLFNPWSNGERLVRTATQGTYTYAEMKQLAHSDHEVAARLKLFDYRVLEEFYDYEHDPDALHNLIDDPGYAHEVDKLRKELEHWMERTGDPCLEALRGRNDPAALAAYMQKVESEGAALGKQGLVKDGDEGGEKGAAPASKKGQKNAPKKPQRKEAAAAPPQAAAPPKE